MSWILSVLSWKCFPQTVQICVFLQLLFDICEDSSLFPSLTWQSFKSKVTRENKIEDQKRKEMRRKQREGWNMNTFGKKKKKRNIVYKEREGREEGKRMEGKEGREEREGKEKERRRRRKSCFEPTFLLLPIMVYIHLFSSIAMPPWLADA